MPYQCPACGNDDQDLFEDNGARDEDLEVRCTALVTAGQEATAGPWAIYDPDETHVQCDKRFSPHDDWEVTTMK